MCHSAVKHHLYQLNYQHSPIQCDQIGRFFIVFIIFYKSIPIFFYFLGYFEKHYFLNRNIWGYILGNFLGESGHFLA